MAPNSVPLGGLPSTVAELRPGDVVFCARPSLLQTWGEAVGGEWRHAGLIVDTDDGLMMSGFGRSQKYCLIPVERLSRYTRIGAARVLDTCEQVEQLHRWLEQYHDGPAEYSTAAVLLGGMYSATRSWPEGLRRRLSVIAIRWFCEKQARRYRGGQAFVCSTFVLAALNAVSPEPIRIPISRSRCEPSTSQDCEPTLTDLLLAQWIASPTDLWYAIAGTRRTDLEFEPVPVPDVAERPSNRGVRSAAVATFAAWFFSVLGMSTKRG